MLLKRVKDLYRSLPPWVTAPVKYIPDCVLFGASFRGCVPRTDVGCLGENLKAALGYVREHTVWGREWMRRDFVWDAIGEKMKAAYEWLVNVGLCPQWG